MSIIVNARISAKVTMSIFCVQMKFVRYFPPGFFLFSPLNALDFLSTSATVILRQSNEVHGVTYVFVDLHFFCIFFVSFFCFSPSNS